MLIHCILIGLIGGLVGGALGLGGGAVMVPLLVYWLGLTQHQAQGTVLAVLTVPVFLLATLRYYVAGNVNLQASWFIIIGFVVGSLLGAHVVQYLPDAMLKRVFGIFVVLIGLKMVFLK